MARLAIIPARGGSKRIPHKNIKPFLGKPIIAYSIETALQSGCFSEVMVSTDDPAIAEVARQYGASVPRLRSARSSDDHATISDVMLEVLADYDAAQRSFDYFCCLFATAPFVRPAQLRSALEQLRGGDFATLVSVQQYHFPILRSLRLDAAGHLQLNWPEHAKTRSQDLPPAYHDAGQFYWARTADYRHEKRFYSSRAGHFLLQDFEAHDIDTPEDWRMAELKYQILQQHG